MLNDFQKSVLQASIREMRRALEDPDTDPGNHAEEAAHIIGYGDSRTLEADLEMTGLPLYGTPVPEPSPDRAAPRPTAIMLAITVQAAATISMQDAPTGERVPVQLSPEDQETVDRYATAAHYNLSGIATAGALGYPGISPATDPATIMDEVRQTLEHLRSCASALSAQAPDEALAATLDKVLNTAELGFQKLAARTGPGPQPRP